MFTREELERELDKLLAEDADAVARIPAKKPDSMEIVRQEALTAWVRNQPTPPTHVVVEGYEALKGTYDLRHRDAGGYPLRIFPRQ